MKQKLFILLLGLAAFLSGCSMQKQESEIPMRISAILPHNDYGYWTIVADGMRDAGKRLPVDVKIHLPDLNYNIPQMTELIRQETAAQVDALIVQGIEDADYISALEEARAQGIRVVLVDTNLPAFRADLYVGTDNYAAGIEMGKRLVEVTGGAAKVAVLSGSPQYPNLEERLQGIRDATAPYPGIQILRVEYDHYDAMTVMEKYHMICQDTPQIDTLAAIEGTGGQTLGQLSSVNFKHILVFDDTEETISGLDRGIFDGIIGQQKYEMGVICVEELYQWHTTGSFTSDRIYTPVNWITKETLEAAHEE